METFSPPPADEAEERVARLGRVKFVGLPSGSAGGRSGPALRDDPPLAGPHAAARPFRLLQLLRRIAFRVDSRPSAARP
jgi:hypothetical protein